MLQACGGGGASGSAAPTVQTVPAEPTLSISTQQVQFDAVAVGSKSAAQSIKISNSGTAPLALTGIALGGADPSAFEFTTACGESLAAGSSCGLSIAFSPQTAGALAATLMIQTNAPASATVALSGQGTAPKVALSTTRMGFQSQRIGAASPPQTISIGNAGTAPLEVLGLSLVGAQAGMFTETSNCTGAVAPAASCSVAVGFEPVASGTASATLTIVTNAGPAQSVALQGSSPSFPPFAASDPNVLLDIGIATLNPRNTWTALPTGFMLDQVSGLAPGTVSDTVGFTPNSGGYIHNYAAFPAAKSTQGTIYMRLQRAAISIDDSTDAGASFFDSTGNTSGSWGANTATAFTVFDGANHILQWGMTAQSTGIQILDGGSWAYPGSRYANSHGSTNLDPTVADIIFTWQGSTYWSYLDGTPVAYGTLTTPLPTVGQFSQIVVGGYLGGAGNSGKPLGSFAIQRFQISTAFSPPPALSGQPLIGVYGDSFVVQGAGVTGNVPGAPGSPTIAQVDGVQAQMDPKTSPNATTGFIGQDGFTSRAQAYAMQHLGGYLQFYTAAESGHGWAYTGMGGTNPANSPAIDDFSVGKTGYSDALNAAQPAYIFGFGSVNDVNNGVPADIVGDVQAHFDYWADHNPNLKGIYYVETLSWELATGACTARGGPAGWKAEMTRQRNLLRAAFAGGYLAGARKVPVTYVKTYETWVLGPNSARFLIASNPDNHTESSNTGPFPNGHPDAEGNIQMVDAYVWPYLTSILSH